MEQIELYVIRNSDGKYFRAKGYSGSGDTWVDIKGARIYPRIGPAKAQITWWGTNYPDYPTPQLIPLIATPGEPIDQTERVKNFKKNKDLKKIRKNILEAEIELKNNKERLEKNWTEYYSTLGEHINKKIEELRKKEKDLS